MKVVVEISAKKHSDQPNRVLFPIPVAHVMSPTPVESGGAELRVLPFFEKLLSRRRVEVRAQARSVSPTVHHVQSEWVPPESEGEQERLRHEVLLRKVSRDTSTSRRRQLCKFAGKAHMSPRCAHAAISAQKALAVADGLRKKEGTELHYQETVNAAAQVLSQDYGATGGEEDRHARTVRSWVQQLLPRRLVEVDYVLRRSEQHRGASAKSVPCL